MSRSKSLRTDKNLNWHVCRHRSRRFINAVVVSVSPRHCHLLQATFCLWHPTVGCRSNGCNFFFRIWAGWPLTLRLTSYKISEEVIPSLLCNSQTIQQEQAHNCSELFQSPTSIFPKVIRNPSARSKIDFQFSSCKFSSSRPFNPLFGQLSRPLNGHPLVATQYFHFSV